MHMLTVAVLALLAVPASAQCDPTWAPGFAGLGADRETRSVTVFDGDLTYLTSAQGLVAWDAIHGWNGVSRRQIGIVTQHPFVGSPFLIGTQAFEIAGQPFLAVCGFFESVNGVAARNVALWNGSTWSALGAGLGTVSTGEVHDVCIYDDGSGPKLYACGEFDVAGGAGIARFDGTSWANVGGAYVFGNMLEVVVEAGGPALYVAGEFPSVAGIATRNIARWDGQTWSGLSSGLDTGVASALAAHDDGTGAALYAGGSFTQVGGVAAAYVAKWDGSSWSTLGSGANSHVSELVSFDDGVERRLHAFGAFTSMGGGPALRAARWNGSTWSALGSGVDAAAQSAVVWADAGGPGICLAGDLSSAGGIATGNIVRWRAGSWDGLEGNGLSGPAHAFAVHDDGSGTRLYVGGSFRRASGRIVNGVARWAGTAWEPVGAGLYAQLPNAPEVNALCVFDDGAGPKLYAAGSFGTTTPPASFGVARWNGSQWEDLAGGGMVSGSRFDALCVHDDGSGPALYAGGRFTQVGSTLTRGVVKWTGSSWSALGAGLAPGATYGGAYALASFDDGGGPALFVGGIFQGPSDGSGISMRNLARWRGGAWSAVGTAIEPAVGGVECLGVFDLGAGPRLWIGGGFTVLGGVSARGVGTWNGTSFSPVGDAPMRYEAFALHDAGAGVEARVYAAGAGNPGVLCWDGTAWLPVGAPVGGSAPGGIALTSFDDGNGAALWLGGDFEGVEPGEGSLHVARFDSTCAEPGLFCFGDGTGSSCPCGNKSEIGERAGCLNSLGLAGTLRTSGFPSLAADSVVLEGGGMPNSTALYFQGANVTAGGLGVPFGDGLKCTNGPFLRLGTVVNASGASQYPSSGGTTLSVRGAVTAPGTRHYQVRYRNAAAFCTPETFNYTNALTVHWAP